MEGRIYMSTGLVGSSPIWIPVQGSTQSIINRLSNMSPHRCYMNSFDNNMEHKPALRLLKQGIRKNGTRYLFKEVR